MLNIIYTKKSIKNLQEISTYISLDNPFQAKQVLENIKYTIEYLKLFPYLWKNMKDWLRLLVSKHKYNIVYKVENEVVYIISIFKYKDFI